METLTMVPTKLCVYKRDTDGEPEYLISCFQVPIDNYTNRVNAITDGTGKTTRLDTGGCKIVSAGTNWLSHSDRRFFPWNTFATLSAWETYLETFGFKFALALPTDLVMQYNKHEMDTSRMKFILQNILTVVKLTKAYM